MNPCGDLKRKHSPPIADGGDAREIVPIASVLWKKDTMELKNILIQCFQEGEKMTIIEAIDYFSDLWFDAHCAKCPLVYEDNDYKCRETCEDAKLADEAFSAIRREDD